MRKEKYIVIGQYDCQRNSWIPGGDIRHFISGHRTESSAWHAAHRAHGALGGCSGSNELAKVMARAPRRFTPGEDEDTYDHEGALYVECDFWAGHSIRHDGLGFVATPK